MTNRFCINSNIIQLRQLNLHETKNHRCHTGTHTVDTTHLLELSFLHVELIKLLLAVLQLLQQVLIQVFELIVFLLLFIRLQWQSRLNKKMIQLHQQR